MGSCYPATRKIIHILLLNRLKSSRVLTLYWKGIIFVSLIKKILIAIILLRMKCRQSLEKVLSLLAMCCIDCNVARYILWRILLRMKCRQSLEKVLSLLAMCCIDCNVARYTLWRIINAIHYIMVHSIWWIISSVTIVQWINVFYAFELWLHVVCSP